MAREAFRCQDYRRIPLVLLSDEEITALAFLTAAAFGESGESSLIQAWSQKRDYTIHLCTTAGVNGFLVVDNLCVSRGIYYIELVVAHPPARGLGTVLHEVAFKDIAQSGDEEKVVLVVTQNPAEIRAFKQAANKLGQACFPFDRPASMIEGKKIDTWLNIGPMRSLRPKPQLNLDLCILYNAFRQWQPQVDKSIKEGELSQFFLDKKINFDEFFVAKNAFILGFSFS